MVPMRGQEGFRPWWMNNPSYQQPGYVSLYASRHGADMSGQQTGKQPGLVIDNGMAPAQPFGGKDMRQVNPGPPLSSLMQARQNGQGHLMRQEGLSGLMPYGQPFGGPAVYY